MHGNDWNSENFSCQWASKSCAHTMSVQSLAQMTLVRRYGAQTAGVPLLL